MANKFSFWCDENNSNIVLQFTIPVNTSEVRTHVTAVETNPFVIIDDFKDLIIDALKKRMQACTEQLMAHVNDFIEATDSEIFYDTKHGIKHFCIPNYNAMSDAIEKLSNCGTDLLNVEEIKQIQKALYWVELKNTRNFSAGQLISALELAERFRDCETPSCCPCPCEEHECNP